MEITAPRSSTLDAAVLARAFGRLPTSQRTILTLRFADGMSESQIAQLLGCRTTAVHEMLRRGLRDLRREFVRTGDPVTPPSWRAIAAHVPSLPPR